MFCIFIQHIFSLQAKEWLCLNCQTHRALSASELTAPPMKVNSAANKMSASAVNLKQTPTNQVENVKKELEKSEAPQKTAIQVADPLQKRGGSTPGSPQRNKPTAVTPATPATKAPQNDTQTRPTPGQKTPLDIAGVSDPKKPADQANKPDQKQIKDPQITMQASGNMSGVSSPKTRPDSSKTTESMTGKMFGFGSSIFSSASNLISSAAQEELRTTPPSSRKMSAPAQVSPKLSAMPKMSPKSTPPVSPKMSPTKEPKTQKQEPKKKPEVPQSKEESALSQPPKMATKSHNVSETSCPLCKVELNVGSKDLPNYNTCTECKTTVCTKCGFNPMPIGEVS